MDNSLTPLASGRSAKPLKSPPAPSGRPSGRAALWPQRVASYSAMAQTEVATSEEPAAPKAEELPRVEITGSAGRTTYSKTGTKIDTETRDVPASVQVISSQISQSFGTSFGGHILQDGYARSGGSFDWSSVAQMEALKEPASVPYGNQYNIGGQVNILSKIPTTKPTSVLLLGEAKDRKYRADPGLSAPSDTIWLSREAWSP